MQSVVTFACVYALIAAVSTSRSLPRLHDRRSVAGGGTRYTEHWAVEVSDGGDATANLLAAKHGFINLGLVINDA